MKKPYAKVVIKGSPITKSNFKLSNLKGRSILPYNTGKYYDRYAIYEEQIAYEARLQNPDVFLTESLIAVLKVFYKSEKRHPDTTNIPKSIFDGIEKSNLIINDAQIRSLIIEEYYDKENPRFELELFGESMYSFNFNIVEKQIPIKSIEYSPPANKKVKTIKTNASSVINPTDTNCCDLCKKPLLNKKEIISANNGKTLICKNCFKKLF